MTSPPYTGEAFIELPEEALSPSGGTAPERQKSVPNVGSGMQEALRLLAIRQPMRLSVTKHVVQGGCN